MSAGLEGKRAIVCGSTQGIGRACAHELARRGAAVTAVARHPEALEQVVGELPGTGHASVCVDFSNWAAVRDAVAEHVRSAGPAHILVNNSGGPPGGPACEADPEEFTRAFSQHLLCNQALVQVLAPGMRDAGYGRVVNIISTSVVTPIRGLGVSNTIRGAVANWGRTIADELGPLGITVNNVLPGLTDTARLRTLIKGKAQRAGVTEDEIEAQMKTSVPARRFGAPEEIAGVVGFLCSPEGAYVNGVNLPVDGGRLAAQ